MTYSRGLLQFHCWSVCVAAWTLYHLAVAASTTCQSYGDELQVCRCNHSETSLEVDCSSSGFPSIPKDIPMNVSFLNLSENHITVVGSGVFKQFKSLTKLDLSYNSITALQNDSLLGLEALQYLNLNGNNISYDTGYDSGSFNSLAHLEVLHILTGPCPSLYPDHIIAGLTGLRELTLYIPKIGSFGDAMSNLTKLDSLYVISNCYPKRKLTVEDLKTLYPTPLRRLSLRNARLNHIEPDALRGFNKTLKKLDISCNSIDNVPEVIGGLAGVKLETLLADNSLSSYMSLRITNETIAALKTMNLTILSIAHNLIVDVEIASAIGSKLEPTNVEYLRIGYNQIVLNAVYLRDLFLALLPFVFKLKVLDISGILNFYDNYPPMINCMAQDALFADDTKGWERDKLVFPAPTIPLWLWTLKALIRYRTKGTITFPPWLTRIYAKDAGKQFTTLGCFDRDDYGEITENNLRTVDARGIHLLRVACYVKGFPALKFVYASQMHLENYNPSFFSQSTMPSLERLDLSYNSLGSFFVDNTSKPLDNMCQVQHLDLSYNGIRQLNEGLFDDCDSLTTLNLSGNSIDNWRASVNGLRRLETLDLSGIPLTSLKKLYLDQFDELRDQWKLTTIYLSNATCDCNLEFITWWHTTKLNVPDFTCYGSDGSTNLPTFALLLWTCVGIYIVSSLCCVLIFAMLGIAFKWRLKYVFYQLRHYFKRNYGYWHVSNVRVYLAYHVSECDRGRLVQQFLSERMDIHNIVSRQSFQIGASEYDEMALHIDRCHFVVLLASPLTTSDPKSKFELYMSLEKGANHILPILVGDLKSYDELPRVLKKLLLMNNHLMWQPSAATASDQPDEQEFFKYLGICVRNIVSRHVLTGFPNREFPSSASSGPDWQ